MNSDPEYQRPKRLSAWLWKGPLGCLAFTLGLGIVLSALMPYACGKVSEAELEHRFDRSHQGSLQIERARLGAIVGEHGFWGVSLFEPEGRLILSGDLLFPSVAALVKAEQGMASVDLRLDLVALREVLTSEAGLTNNLQLAFAPRGIDLGQEPEREPAADADEDGTNGAFPIVSEGQSDGSVHFDFSDNNLSVKGLPKIEVKGTLGLMTWSDLEDQRRLILREGDLWGSVDNPEDQAVGVFELSGNLISPGDPDATGMLHVRATYRVSELSDLAAWPSELLVELEGESETLIEALDQALGVLTQNRIKRRGDAALWILRNGD